MFYLRFKINMNSPRTGALAPCITDTTFPRQTSVNSPYIYNIYILYMQHIYGIEKIILCSENNGFLIQPLRLKRLSRSADYRSS